VSILWGEHDPWEPLSLAKPTFADLPSVREFTILPGGGHCPMDQIPGIVNKEILRIVQQQRSR
jgi:pimeloyl-ACP methyl ester carboxylesterase